MLVLSPLVYPIVRPAVKEMASQPESLPVGGFGEGDGWIGLSAPPEVVNAGAKVLK
jgi:hypothetical protein